MPNFQAPYTIICVLHVVKEFVKSGRIVIMKTLLIDNTVAELRPDRSKAEYGFLVGLDSLLGQ